LGAEFKLASRYNLRIREIIAIVTAMIIKLQGRDKYQVIRRLFVTVKEGLDTRQLYEGFVMGKVSLR
jgi:hypothetical protein